jgi:hypothetical protein
MAGNQAGRLVGRVSAAGAAGVDRPASAQPTRTAHPGYVAEPNQVQAFTPRFLDAAHKYRHRIGRKWRVDETLFKIAGGWCYAFRFRRRARRMASDSIATPVRSPRANAVGERVIGTLRRECLDHLIVLDGQHLRSVLAEFVRYYNRDRPRRPLGLQTPEPEGAIGNRSDPVTPGAERPAPCLRACYLNGRVFAVAQLRGTLMSMTLTRLEAPPRRPPQNSGSTLCAPSQSRPRDSGAPLR